MPFFELLYVAPDVPARLGVEPERRLVQEQYLRGVHEARARSLACAACRPRMSSPSCPSSPSTRPARALPLSAPSWSSRPCRTACRGCPGCRKRSAACPQSGPGKLSRMDAAHLPWLGAYVEAVHRRGPDVGSSSVASMYIVVLFPAPLGPSRPKSSPSFTLKLIPPLP